jgi:hypothetical protein
MSTLITSMETIVNPTPWLDRPRNAAKVMAYANTLLGIIAILPNLMGFYLSLWGYILCFGYWRIASGSAGRPERWWKFSMAYNGLLGTLTVFLLAMDLPDGGEYLHVFLAFLAWQIGAFHLSFRGNRADAARGIPAIPGDRGRWSAGAPRLPDER